jgi:hypothetical protein
MQRCLSTHGRANVSIESLSQAAMRAAVLFHITRKKRRSKGPKTDAQKFSQVILTIIFSCNSALLALITFLSPSFCSEV